MKIILNALRPVPGGNERYTTEIIRRVSHFKDIELIIAAIKKDSKKWRKIAPSAIIRVASVLPYPLGLLSERRFLKKLVAQERPDVFHSPTTLLPLWRPSCATVVTIHDLNFLVLPHGRFKKLYKKCIYAYAASKADAIIAVSRFTKDTLTTHFPSSSGRVQVIWEGHGINKKLLQTNWKEFERDSYLLTFGHWPHKNVEGALKVLSSIRTSGFSISLKIIGEGLYLKDVISPLAKSMGLSDYVNLIGVVSEEQLIELYKGATALVFLSKYEGFGLPVVEAMALGCPVIVSDRGALPEILGGHGHMVRIDDYESAADYVRRLLREPSWAVMERNEIMDYAAGLTWERTVSETVELYRSTVDRETRSIEKRNKILIEANRTMITALNNSMCLVCNSKVSVVLLNVTDTRFGIEEKRNICRCLKCETEQTLPAPNPQELKNLYETHYNFGGEKGTTYTGFREYFFSSVLYRFWLIVDGDISFHNQKGFGRLLDVGCNEGRGLSIYQKNGFESEGLELNEQAAAEARKRGFNVDTDPIETLQPKDPYDIVVLSNVLEHSLDPKDMLTHVARILKPGGQVWISSPNVDSWQCSVFGRYWINWHVPFHIVHFSRSTLTNILKETGFEIQEIRQESPALWVAHSIIVRLFAKFGKPTKQLRNPLLITTLLILIRVLFFPLLWLGNRLGRGDCLVVLAQKVSEQCAH